MVTAKRSSSGCWHITAPDERSCLSNPDPDRDGLVTTGCLTDVRTTVKARVEADPAAELCDDCNWTQTLAIGTLPSLRLGHDRVPERISPSSGTSLVRVVDHAADRVLYAHPSREAYASAALGDTTIAPPSVHTDQ